VSGDIKRAEAWLERRLCWPPDVLLACELLLLADLTALVLLAAQPGLLAALVMLLPPAKSSPTPPPVIRARCAELDMLARRGPRMASDCAGLIREGELVRLP